MPNDAVRKRRAILLCLAIVVAIALVFIGNRLTRRPSTPQRPSVTFTLDAAGAPQWHGLSLANTNVRDGVFQTMGSLGLQAGVAVPNPITNANQASNLFETMDALNRAGLLQNSRPPNPYE